MTNPELDLVIVGGGPAGISTALHVQHHAPEMARRMVVLEKAKYPREKPCAGAIGKRAHRILARIGVHVDVPRVAIHALSLHVDGETVRVAEPDIADVVRRYEFDHALAQTAMARGIDVRDGAPVRDVEVREDGVRVHLQSGETLRARAVVGADGVGGIVRRSTGFSRGALRAQVAEVDTEPVDADLPRDTLHFDFRLSTLNGYAWDFPTVVGGHGMVCRGVYAIHEGRAEDLRGRLREYMAPMGLDSEGYRLKRYAERGYEPDAPIARPRVLLVGEAAGIDIATGEGIPQAIAYGAQAGPYLAERLRRGEVTFDDWAARIRATSVGRRLRIRHALYRAFYSDERPRMEPALRRAPATVRAFARDFAGRSLVLPEPLRTAREIPRLTAGFGPRFAQRMLGRG